MSATITDEVNFEKLSNNISYEDIQFITYLYLNDELIGLDKLGKGGAFGNVCAYKDYAIKLLHSRESSSNDVEILKEISHLESVPTLHAVIDDRVIIVDRVRGKTVNNYYQSCYAYKQNLYKVTDKIIYEFENALIDIIKLGYSPQDLHGQNVMIDIDGSVKIVDVGNFEKHYEDGDLYDINSDWGYRDAIEWTGGIMNRMVEKFKEFDLVTT